MNLHSRSAWSSEQVREYLVSAETPMRIACSDTDGYPTVCSLWFLYAEGIFWSASHKNSHLVKVIASNPKIGIEVATNEYPYHGVRGKADVELVTERAADVLQGVIDKYLGTTNQKLADWLMSRADDEYALKMTPIKLNAWDFSNRMQSQ